MRAIVFGLISGATCFVAGWLFANSWVAPSKTDPDSASRRESISAGTSDLLARLDRIESALAQPRVSDSASTPTRTPASDAPGGPSTEERLRALETKIDQLLAGSAAAATGLAEIAMTKPEPDQAALAKLLAAGKDVLGVRRLVTGMSYRDATISFGTPTKKRDVPNSSIHDMPVAMWLWDHPAAGKVLMIEFAGGYAHTGYFAPRNALDEN